MPRAERRQPVDWACWALRHPQHLPGLTATQWEPVVQQARRADVLARIAVSMQDTGQLQAVPDAPRAHLQAALQVVRAQHAEVRLEARQIAVALRGLGIPVLLLKGAAYVVAGLPAARGRLFSDTDILVPRAALREVEGALMLHGWLGAHLDAYDQRYYRQWMHELPPMSHLTRGSTLDVHHNILPLTVRRPPDADRLLMQSQPVPGADGLRMLGRADMVLHSMTHLFHNDDLSHGLRDLSDLDLLLRAFADDTSLWSQLVERAQVLHLQRPLAYGLWATRELLGTPVPDAALVQAGQAAALDVMTEPMRSLWRRALRTPHADAALPGQALAVLLLYVRAHWLRMPPLQLAYHLGYKAWKRLSRTTVT